MLLLLFLTLLLRISLAWRKPLCVRHLAQLESDPEQASSAFLRPRPTLHGILNPKCPSSTAHPCPSC